VAYGVCCNSDDDGNVYDIAGVEVSGFDELPSAFARLRIPAQRYAVFRIAGHISTIRGARKAIWTEWLPRSGHRVADAPAFERYGETFDPVTGNGGFEIWIPIRV